MSLSSSLLPDFTGSRIDNGALRLTRRLRAGGCGVVYRAVDAKSPLGCRSEYAVKCMLKAEPDSPHAVLQRREIALHRAVSHHSNVITLHRVVEEGAYMFVVMDLCESGDLFDAVMVRQLYERNVELVKLAFTRLIDAVEECHNRGVFHRDLKLDNVLVSSDGAQVWLTDFGLATSDAMSKEFGCGTSNFMSPECLRIDPSVQSFSTVRNDIWALGVILFNMVTSRNPWNVARTADPTFSDYLRNPNFFRTRSLSDAATSLFRRIFVMKSSCHISLADLRKEVRKIDSFFVRSSSPFKAPNSYISNFYGLDSCVIPASSPSSFPSLSDLHAVLDAVATPLPSLRTDFIPCIYIVPVRAESDLDSDGPETPETHPVCPAVDVPDLSDGKSLDFIPCGEPRKQNIPAMDDDDDFLYGESSATPEVSPPAVVTPIESTVPQPIPVAMKAESPVDQLESIIEETFGHGSAEPEVSYTPEPKVEEQGEDEAEGEGEGEGEEEEEGDESEDDVEIIMEPTSRSLDLRPQHRPSGNRPVSATFTPTKPPQQPGPSLTTEYTPRERGGRPQTSDTLQQSSQSAIGLSQTPSTGAPAFGEEPLLPKVEEGPDPSTLPPVTAPPSHPSINPSAPGMFDGRSILEVDLASMAEKAWRRPGSDISDWFNYGFDEISWEAYCFRRREVGELASVLKANVLNFSGMPEDQLAQLPPEIRTMVMAGANAMMAAGGGGQMMGGMNGMMGPGVGDMNMQGMMGAMLVPMGGEMGMDGAGSQGQAAQQEQGMGEGFPQQGPPGAMGMAGMSMGAEFAMQDPNAMQQQMYQPMETPTPPTPVPVASGPRGGAPSQFRGRVMSQGMRARGGYAPRGRGLANVPIRPASPLPPNVPTGPRNQNKYKDRDNNAQAVDGLDYGGGQDRGGSTPLGDFDDRGGRLNAMLSRRKRRDRSPGDDRREAKRR
ncbi:hypothetical protein EW146_g2071 [Bondarzewia mesenterica]|uniref:Protein kinase domain-containing protein n=1 Tax=Bondarzewia mesenterica TaxID=1095465 RepID=A0A4S4M3Q8_9AGAM|nr:hypothetical protein EW146_g2071 [Bondarzewia mesenterica]